MGRGRDGEGMGRRRKEGECLLYRSRFGGRDKFTFGGLESERHSIFPGRGISPSKSSSTRLISGVGEEADLMETVMAGGREGEGRRGTENGEGGRKVREEERDGGRGGGEWKDREREEGSGERERIGREEGSGERGRIGRERKEESAKLPSLLHNHDMM